MVAQDASVVVLASGNAGKLAELSRILSPLPFSLRSQAEFDMPDVVEDGLSFVENAIIKARAVAKFTGHATIADDSGLEVDHLLGAPGIYSARYSGEGDAANNAKLLTALAMLPRSERTARFQCVLVYMRHWRDPTPIVCQGSWEGEILFEAAGVNGFGYDPLFFLSKYQCSSAQLDAAEKNRVSHRAKASVLLLEALRQR
ncbi:MAG: XTP/dITP diphosphohydrolase [Halioglobus sp.]|jgi:XTP/dITP diphosphohydrolase